MTADAARSAPVASLTAEDLRRTTFPETRGRSLGYDPAHVDAFIERCAASLEQQTARLHGQEKEIAALKRRIMEPDNQDRVLQSLNVLTKAQLTADSTVANANAYSGRVMAEARSMYDDARRRAAEMVEEAHRQATAAADVAASTHGELERQTAYLRTLRDVTRIQMEKFLGGLLDHVAAEYGKAQPSAAEAAAQDAAKSALSARGDSRREVASPDELQALSAQAGPAA
jgi:DivIVA domain-containing protein